MAFLAELKQGPGQAGLRRFTEEVRDRSAANVALCGRDVLEDEAERWRYFFESGCEAWFDELREHTFRSTFVELRREEAAAIVEHWERRQQALAAATAEGRSAEGDLEMLLANARDGLEPLATRLQEAVAVECAASPAGLAFVKLSTRSPKDSRAALGRAAAAYRSRLAALAPELQGDDNERWKVLCEEVAHAGAVTTGAEAVVLLLDSARVFEDLEYALRGPKAAGELGPSGPCEYGLSLVARAWDPRLGPRSEFRGIVWDGRLTCLGQYFHPLHFAELGGLKGQIEADCLELFGRPAVGRAVRKLGGHCIVDFAWLGPGEVLIVELNPFDGVCIGTFPASTGLFLWDDDRDRRVMRGEAPFEFRIRTERLSTSELKAQCSPDWRSIIYEARRAAAEP